MRKTKNFNIQVPELGDVPDITQVSDAIQDLEDALAGTLEIMNASIQGSKLTLRSVARQTKRTKYYDGMSIRFLCPQTISANTLKTVVVDDLPKQVITVSFDIIAGEYVDITYRGTSFTAHPVMIQKSESIDSNSNETVATSRAVKKVNDKANELKVTTDKCMQMHGVNSVSNINENLEIKNGFYTVKNQELISGEGVFYNIMSYSEYNQPASSQIAFPFNYSKNGNEMYFRTAKEQSWRQWNKVWHNGNLNPNNLKTNSKEVIGAINELKRSTDGKEATIDKKTGFNLDKSDSVSSSDTNTLATSLAVKKANDNANTRVLKSGDTFTGTISFTGLSSGSRNIYFNNTNGRGAIYCGGNDGDGISFINYVSDKKIMFKDDGGLILQANNLETPNKEVVAAINYVLDFTKNLIKTKVVRVAKDYFKTITTRPVVDERHLVEATYDTGIQNIIAVAPVNAHGYMEYATLFESGSTKIMCGQCIDTKYYNEKEGYMDILITYINI